MKKKGLMDNEGEGLKERAGKENGGGVRGNFEWRGQR